MKHLSPTSLYWPTVWAVQVWRYLLFQRVTVLGRGHIPQKGRVFVIAAKHWSMLDPPFLTWVFGRLGHLIHFMANAKLSASGFGKWYFPRAATFSVDLEVPAKKLGALRQAVRILKSGESIGLFPEGTRVPRNTLGKCEKGAAWIARMAESPICPIGIAYRPFALFSGWFYRLMCRVLGARISAAIRATYGLRVAVSIGEPITYEELIAASDPDELVQRRIQEETTRADSRLG